MGKVGKQTKENKKKFWSPLLSILKSNEFKTKQEIMDQLVGTMGERAVRDEINSIGKFEAVIRGSFVKGYRLARHTSELSNEELVKENNYIKRTKNEFMSRINDMKKTMKALIAQQKVYEKEMIERGIEI